VRPRQNSVDGVELTFATNVLGYYLLMRELLDLLRASASARIVNVASTFASDLDLDDLQFERRPFAGVQAYAQSKACDRMLTWALARRLDTGRVTGLVPETGAVPQFAVGATTEASPKRRAQCCGGCGYGGVVGQQFRRGWFERDVFRAAERDSM